MGGGQASRGTVGGQCFVGALKKAVMALAVGSFSQRISHCLELQREMCFYAL